MKYYNLKTKQYEEMDLTNLEILSQVKPHQRRKRRSKTPNSKLVKLSEAAGISGFSRETIKRYAVDKKSGLVVARRGRMWYINRKSLNDFLERIEYQKGKQWTGGKMGRPKLLDE